MVSIVVHGVRARLAIWYWYMYASPGGSFRSSLSPVENSPGMQHAS